MHKPLNKSDNALVLLARMVWHYSSGNRPAVATYVVMQIIARTLNVIFQPWIMAGILQVVQEMETNGITPERIDNLEALLWWTLGIEILFWCFHGPARYIEQMNAFRLRVNYRSFMLKGLLTLPFEWHAEHHSGDTIDRVKQGTDALYKFAEDSFELITLIVRMVESYLLIVYCNLLSSAVMAVMLAVGFFVTIYADGILLPLYDLIEAAENYVSEKIFDNLSNITTILCLSYERSIHAAFVSAMWRSYEHFRKIVLVGESKWCLNQICCSLTTILVCKVYFASHQEGVNAIKVAEVYLLLQYLWNLNATFFSFTSHYGGLVKKKALVLRCEELATHFHEESLANHVLKPNWREIVIEDLEYTYASGRETPHLIVPRCTIHRGERIAIVGGSGGGKTTLVMLLRAMLKPQRLRLSVDDELIADGFPGISRAIALVPQLAEIFAMTVKGNLTFDVETATETLAKALQVSCFDEVVEELPNGLETSLKEKGVNLSGGQRQRLGLGRALIVAKGEEKDILILDEPTSALDEQTKWKFFDALFTEFTRQAIIASVHDIRLLRKFTTIWVVNDGLLVATGTYDQLITTCPEFIALCTAGERIPEPAPVN